MIGRNAMALFCLLLTWVELTSAQAKSPSIFGTWKIVSASPAPWIHEGEKEVESDRSALIGRAMVFGAHDVQQPSPPLAAHCRPDYENHAYGADMLFEGGLTDPAKQAEALGFRNKSIAVVETGCEGVAEFQFVDANTLLFALNNSIYRMERSKP